MRSLSLVLGTIIVAAAAAACSSPPVPPAAPDTGGDHTEVHTDADASGTFRLVSPAFEAGAAIPARFTCDGEDVSPPLQWNDQPDGTQSLAIVVVDDDAPVPGGFTHWVLAGLDPPGGGVGEATTEGVAGPNSAGTSGWSGPCPPSGTHTYVFSVHAFDHATDFGGAPTREKVESEPGLLATTTLTGTYTATSQGDD